MEHDFYDFPYIGNVIIPTDELIFFRGVGIPPTSIYIYIPMLWQWVKVGWPKCPKHEWVDEWEHLQEMIVLSWFIMFYPQIESVIQFCRIRVNVKRIFHGHL